MLGFKVLDPGMFSTFQDKGRLGYQNQGLPVSGVMDKASMMIANRLVNQEQAVLEMTYLGAKIEFLKEMSIAITGADMAPMINNREIFMYKTIKVKSGDVLSFKGLITGFRTYIAFSDDLVLESLFNSTSTYTKISTGGYEGRALIKGDEVAVLEKCFDQHFHVLKPNNNQSIRVLLGYECDTFLDKDVLFNSTYKVTGDLDRMGIRLEGEVISHKDSADIISSPIIPGAIQIPKSGQPMVMLRDAQTIGGYTRIGTVISCDLDLLAQVKPGDLINFECIGLEKAVQAKKDWVHSIKELKYCDDRQHYKISINKSVYDVFVEEI